MLHKFPCSAVHHIPDSVTRILVPWQATNAFEYNKQVEIISLYSSAALPPEHKKHVMLEQNLKSCAIYILISWWTLIMCLIPTSEHSSCLLLFVCSFSHHSPQSHRVFTTNTLPDPFTLPLSPPSVNLSHPSACLQMHLVVSSVSLWPVAT